MAEVTSCLICQGFTHARPAEISHFLIWRTGLDQSYTLTRYCDQCEFVFFQRRLSTDENNRLYYLYRGEEYNTQRQKFESNYLQTAELLRTEESILNRKRMESYREYFIRCLGPTPEGAPLRILDFGGDGEIPKALFPDADVEFDDLAAGQSKGSRSYDLIFAANVFEHLSDPMTTLKTLLPLLADKGRIFLDVPKQYEGSLRQAIMAPRILGPSLTLMHEHVTHWSASALRELFTRAGLQTLNIGRISEVNSGLFDGQAEAFFATASKHSWPSFTITEREAVIPLKIRAKRALKRIAKSLLRR